ncbi:MAG: hypothetical protein GVY12_12785 [Bacteroidetes bacterium]|jgi:hypothetical protein|nr:hypothetical protein [Bacteroidota bacterium]
MKSILWYTAGGGGLILGLTALIAGADALLHGHWLNATLGAALTGYFVAAAVRCGYKGTGAPVPTPLDRWHERLWMVAVVVAVVRIVATV